MFFHNSLPLEHRPMVPLEFRVGGDIEETDNGTSNVFFFLASSNMCKGIKRTLDGQLLKT